MKDSALAGTFPQSQSARLVLHCLERIVTSRTFASSEVLQRLLKHLVSHVLRAEEFAISENSLGIEVFRRKESFDPRIDTIVRVQIRRLRLRLTQYYKTEGRHDPLCIEIPKGSYIPVFHPVKSRIAVLPFLDLREGASGNNFADLLTEILIDAFTEEETLDVTARTSVFQFKEQHKDIRHIGKLLNVDTILEGSLQGRTASFRIKVRLVNVATGFTLWTTSLEAKTEDNSNIHEHISNAIVPPLKAALLNGGHLMVQ